VLLDRDLNRAHSITAPTGAGTLAFTLTVKEADETAQTVAITMKAVPNLTGVAIFKVEDGVPIRQKDAKGWDIAGKNETTEDAANLQDALIWVDRYATAHNWECLLLTPLSRPQYAEGGCS
jgi:hypothetical protein